MHTKVFSFRSLIAAFAAGAALLFMGGCAKQNALTIYTSVDRDYAEPIIQTFMDQNPEMEVNVVYDTEVTKTTGLYVRLRQEKRTPQADVFWNNEFARTVQLKLEDMLQPYQSPSAADIPAEYKDPAGYWTGFSARARVMLINRDKLPVWPAGAETPTFTPDSISDLGVPKYRGNMGMANPAFGTTGTHIAALFTTMGEQQTLATLVLAKSTASMQIRSSNSDVRDRVAEGTLWYGLTDSDDAYGALLDGKPVEMRFLDQDGGGTLVIPNTVSLIKGCQHPDNGKKFIDYILSPEVEQKLAETRARQMPVRSSIPVPEGAAKLSEVKAMKIDYEAVAKEIEPCVEALRSHGLIPQ
ncbi:MAG: extracellular solute-binding protein [bacterium]|nr:extracellular solute-binding protein [bacterium]